MEWFKCIGEFDQKEESVWTHDESVIIDLDAWKNKDKLEPSLALAYSDASVGERKRMKTNIIRFIAEVDDPMMQVGNETFYATSKECKDETIISLADLSFKACKVHFSNEDGKAICSRLQKNKNENTQSVNAIIPFGPWMS